MFDVGKMVNVLTSREGSRSGCEEAIVLLIASWRDCVEQTEQWNGYFKVN